MKLFVDDIRKAPKGWTLCRTISEAIRLLSQAEITEVSLDHDCGYIHSKSGKIASENFACLAFVIRLLPPEHWPKKVYVHSSNTEAFNAVRFVLHSDIQVINGAPEADEN